MANNTRILELVNGIMRRIPGLEMKDSLNLQKFLDEGVTDLIRKEAIGKEAISEFLFQKKPPHNIELEAMFIGKVLLFPSKTLPTCNGVTPDYFYDIRHRWIWETISFLWDEGKKVTTGGIVSTLSSNNRLEDAGGKRYLAALEKDQSSIKDLSDRIEELTSYFILRGVWSQSAEAIHECFDISPADAEKFRHKVIEGLSQYTANNVKNYDNGADLAEKLKGYRLKKMESALLGGISGHHSPVKDLDQITDGWQDTDLIIVAGRPGMGKTAFAISDVVTALLKGESILFFSLEMSSLQLAKRIFCIMKGYKVEELLMTDKIGELANKAFDKFVEEELPNLPVFIDDSPGINWRYMQDKALFLKNKYGIDRIYIDYLQLMSGVNDKVFNTEQIVSENSRGIKIMAKSCKCPVILLSQLSRQCESRPDKRPIPSDLRSSGAIEQDADIIIFTYRDEYYKIFQDDNGNPTDGVGELIIAKHREGSLGMVKAFFNAPLTKWSDLHNLPAGYVNATNEKAKEEDWDF